MKRAILSVTASLALLSEFYANKRFLLITIFVTLLNYYYVPLPLSPSPSGDNNNDTGTKNRAGPVARMDPRWKHPFTCIVSGPTMAGKSVFVKRFLASADTMCDTTFDKIYLHYAEWQNAYLQLPSRVEFRAGPPAREDYEDEGRTKLVVLDDLMRETNDTVVDFFTKGSHHRNMSVIFITQNLYHQGKGQRDISLNANYLVVFKNPRDKSQISFLARQVWPENPRFLQEIYNDATSVPHGYLLLDMKQSTPDRFRFRTRIFPSDRRTVVYVPKTTTSSSGGGGSSRRRRRNGHGDPYR